MRILLVEDNVCLADTLAEALTDQRYMVDVVNDGEAGWTQARVLNYDLMLLEVMLPDINGIRLCQRLRSQGYNMPILLITDCDASTDKINGLDAGADDYVVKPVHLGELFARVRALLRRSSSSLSPILQWGDLRLNPSTYEVSYGGKNLHLTPKEYSLLELLLRNGRRVMSRSMIIEHIWSLESPPEEYTVKVHISSLRQKLRAAGSVEDIIETVHGLGYQLKQLSACAS